MSHAIGTVLAGATVPGADGSAEMLVEHTPAAAAASSCSALVVGSSSAGTSHAKGATPSDWVAILSRRWPAAGADASFR